MCVIPRGRTFKGPVKAWKLVIPTCDGKTFIALCHDDLYCLGHTYKAPKDSPGFQAFVHFYDAVRASNFWDATIIQVELFGARQGKIDGMSDSANGKLGWIARKMRLPKKSKPAKS